MKSGGSEEPEGHEGMWADGGGNEEYEGWRQ